MPGYCSKCGKELREGDAFCPSCGTNTMTPPDTSRIDNPGNDRVRCPECGSVSVFPTKRRYRSKKVNIHCLKCGHNWSVKTPMSLGMKVFLVLLVAYALLMCILNATGVIEKNGTHNVTSKKSIKMLKNSR